jgi:monothiol glutaredoxin
MAIKLLRKRIMMDTQKRINQQVTTNPVVLYMKGTPKFPQCGFSGAAIKMLAACGGPKLFTVDVLTDQAIRDGIKSYANWPTIPQLYIKGEFVGGSDIMREMFDQGELQKMLQAAEE